jgi:hypothetical protein
MKENVSVMERWDEVSAEERTLRPKPGRHAWSWTQAAAILGVSRTTLTKYKQRNAIVIPDGRRIPFYQFGGHRHYVPKATGGRERWHEEAFQQQRRLLVVTIYHSGVVPQKYVAVVAQPSGSSPHVDLVSCHLRGGKRPEMFELDPPEPRRLSFKLNPMDRVGCCLGFLAQLLNQLLPQSSKGLRDRVGVE